MLALLGRPHALPCSIAPPAQTLESAARQPGRLLVVDSIAHLFRDAGAAAGGAPGGAGAAAAAYGARAGLLFRIAALLKRYADDFQLAVVVTNQARRARASQHVRLCNRCTTVVRCVERVHHALGGLAATARSSHERWL